ncbi:ABC transporter permease [Rhodococcus sp. NPDC058532]|uniref:ABC transporter permease n=1 Tax=Rhodococcus sp. NPDC058532 TaxID=3346540 RepID=UPI003646F77B
MLRYTLGKLAHVAVVVALVSTLTFLILEFTPGDPAAAVVGPNGTAEQYEAVRAELALDAPVAERFFGWAGSALTGDLGTSLLPPRQDVTDIIMSKLPVTLELALVAIVLSLAIAVPVGIWSAYRAGRTFDRVSSAASFALISTPSFLAGLLLIYLFVFNHSLAQQIIIGIGVLIGAAVALGPILRRGVGGALGARWGRSLLAGMGVAAVLCVIGYLLPEFPRQGFSRLTDPAGLGENLRTVFLPALTLALTEIAIFTRVLRTDMISTLQQDFVLSAKAKGMPAGHVLVKEALRPSTVSLITIAGVSLGRLIGGTVVVETMFNLPGMGTMIVEAVQLKNFPVVQGGVLVIAIVYVLINALVDIAYAAIDPRIRRA